MSSSPLFCFLVILLRSKEGSRDGIYLPPTSIHDDVSCKRKRPTTTPGLWELATPTNQMISIPGPQHFAGVGGKQAANQSLSIPCTTAGAPPCIYKPRTHAATKTHSPPHVTPSRTHGDATGRDLDNETRHSMPTLSCCQAEMYPGRLGAHLHTMPPKKPGVWFRCHAAP